jgi:signal peptidase II
MGTFSGRRKAVSSSRSSRRWKKLKRAWPSLALSTFVVTLDQWSKTRIRKIIPLDGKIRINAFLNLTDVENRGAAFSFLNGHSEWPNLFFLGLASMVSTVILFWILRLPKTQRRLSIALCLILGGAVGNALDRLRYGYVIDFIQVHYGVWYYPAFNVADSAITVGAILLFWHFLRPGTRKHRPAN